MLLSVFVAAPAVAATNSFGVNVSVESAVGIQGEFDISSMVNKAPVSLQVFLKNYSQHIAPGASWSTTGVGMAGIVDLSSFIKLDKRIQPYVGLGLISVSYRWRGNGPNWNYSGVGSGLYVTLGARYVISPKFAADLNYNDFGGLTVGANFSF